MPLAAKRQSQSNELSRLRNMLQKSIELTWRTCLATALRKDKQQWNKLEAIDLCWIEGDSELTVCHRYFTLVGTQVHI